MKLTASLVTEIIGFITLTTGLNYELIVGGDIGWVSIVVGGLLVSYGDIRYRIGHLEGKMELISKNMKVIMKDKNGEK